MTASGRSGCGSFGTRYQRSGRRTTSSILAPAPVSIKPSSASCFRAISGSHRRRNHAGRPNHFFIANVADRNLGPASQRVVSSGI